MTIPEEVLNRFYDFCLDRRSDDDVRGYFALSFFEMEEGTPLCSQTKPDGEPLWEFHAANYAPDDSYDINALLASAKERSGGTIWVEQHGYDEFWVCGVDDVAEDEEELVDTAD